MLLGSALHLVSLESRKRAWSRLNPKPKSWLLRIIAMWIGRTSCLGLASWGSSPSGVGEGSG